MKTIKVVSAHFASQGPFVVINIGEFDPEKHTPYSQEDEDALRAAPASSLNPALVAGAREDLSRLHADLQDEAARQREQAEILEAERHRQVEQAKALEADRLAHAEQVAELEKARAAMAEQTKVLEQPVKAPKGATK